MKTARLLFFCWAATCMTGLLSAHTPIEVVVHRGANHLAPENTIPAALAALKEGATWVEVDVRPSKDDVLFNLHDETLERTTNGSGPLADMPAEEVEKLDTGSWFGREFAGTKVPRIAEMLDSLKGKANVFFDVKRGTSVSSLVALVREKGYEENSFFWFAEPAMQDSLQRLAPHLKLKVNASSISELQRWMKTCQPAVVEIAPEQITPEFTDFCHRHGIRIMAAVMEADEHAYRTAIEKNADLINLDRPELFRAILQHSLQRIAFIADVHLQDVEGHPELVRSMQSQIHSTRLFNENYYAFMAALDDVVRRHISLVVLPGDLTDDGQEVNQEAMRQILDNYSRRYGLSFFVTTGNHDPQRPFGMEYTGSDFLTPDGGTTTLASAPSPGKEREGIRVDSALHCAGYRKTMECYARFGYFPRPEYLYWESPFSTYSYTEYSYPQALAESKIENRSYTLCDSLVATDASYLVEPAEGVWLLAIDGSVHLPTGKAGSGQEAYQGAGAGYNNVLKHKPFLLPWVGKVAAEAQRRHKQLVAFCHYPLAEFNCGASPLIASAWGKEKFDLQRVPADSITEAFLEAGIRLHVAGHMHVNNTSVRTGKDGSRLYNIQVPSIATCLPAYKILTLMGTSAVQVETIVLDSVPGFDRLFPLYGQEYRHALASGKKPEWGEEILRSKNYGEYCSLHFRNLVCARFIPQDIPSALTDGLAEVPGAALPTELPIDLYRLRYAGTLALEQIPAERIKQYQEWFDKTGKLPLSQACKEQVEALEKIFGCFLHPLPNDNFTILTGDK